MKNKLRFALAFVLLALMLTQVAFAANCEFTFTANGKTYYAIHNTAEGYYQCLNPEKDTSPRFNDPSAEYLAYDNAFYAAKVQHTCPYQDLGDESIPMALLYGSVVLVAISAIIVHQKRKRIQ